MANVKTASKEIHLRFFLKLQWATINFTCLKDSSNLILISLCFLESVGLGVVACKKVQIMRKFVQEHFHKISKLVRQVCLTAALAACSFPFS